MGGIDTIIFHCICTYLKSPRIKQNKKFLKKKKRGEGLSLTPKLMKSADMSVSKWTLIPETLLGNRDMGNGGGGLAEQVGSAALPISVSSSGLPA